jgi:hypothetical protein
MFIELKTPDQIAFNTACPECAFLLVFAVLGMELHLVLGQVLYHSYSPSLHDVCC